MAKYIKFILKIKNKLNVILNYSKKFLIKIKNQIKHTKNRKKLKK